MPKTLWRALDDELCRSDVVPESDEEERRQAVFLARLTVECFAPSALRRAGYRRMAMQVARGTLRPAAAQHAIGRQYVGKGLMLGPPAAAYSVSAHAATAAFYAGHQDINVAVEAGQYPARALLAPLEPMEDEVDEAVATGIWDCAVRTINMTMNLAPLADVIA